MLCLCNSNEYFFWGGGSVIIFLEAFLYFPLASLFPEVFKKIWAKKFYNPKESQ